MEFSKNIPVLLQKAFKYLFHAFNRYRMVNKNYIALSINGLKTINSDNPICKLKLLREPLGFVTCRSKIYNKNI